MNWNSEKVIVYGGNGFLGRYVVERLLELGCGRVSSFSRNPAPELQKLGVITVQGDLRDPHAVTEAARDCGAVILCAAKAGVWGSWHDYYSINVRGTLNVLDACRRHGIDAMVYTSSPSVAYNPDTHIENRDESLEYPSKYLAHYPATKAIAEKQVLGCDNIRMSAIALRPHLIWGPRDPHLLPKVLKRARQGKLTMVGDGHNKVDLTHAANAAEAHVLALQRIRQHQGCLRKAYFISDDNPLELWPWINSLCERLKLPGVSRAIPFQKAYAAGCVCECVYKAAGLLLPGLEPPITRFVAGQLAFSHYFDISAARRELGYQPVINPELALDDTITWLKSQGFGS